MPCARNPNHGHHPELEECWCEVDRPRAETLRERMARDGWRFHSPPHWISSIRHWTHPKVNRLYYDSALDALYADPASPLHTDLQKAKT